MAIYIQYVGAQHVYMMAGSCDPQGNLLVDESKHVRLADFGLSDFATISDASISTARPGAIRYMAPEILRPELVDATRPRHSPSTDMYSFAQVCWHVRSISAMSLFAAMSQTFLLTRCAQGRSRSPSSPTSRCTSRSPQKIAWTSTNHIQPCGATS